jgi:HEAT repeat protein
LAIRHSQFDIRNSKFRMLVTILVIVIVVALIFGFRGGRGLSLNETLYLKRRGYEPPIEIDEGPPVSKDTRLFNLIESLADISPFARQRAAEDLSRMCVSGQRDLRMLPALIAALDDSDASVRAAVATALGNLRDRSSLEVLKRRMDEEESIHVRASLEQAIEKLRQ